MLPAPIPSNESERIASLRRMLLLSTPDEEGFDRVTRTAQRLFKVPIALVSLIDENRQWFKSCIGLPVRETGRDVSFCGHAILNNELFVIEDARKDARFADNPLVTSPPHVIFYAGRPLRNAEGFNVGTLCIIDHEPRLFSDDDRRSLQDMGYWIEHIFYGRELGDIQKEMLHELDEMHRTNMLDPMLNIWNPSAALQMLEREIQRAFKNKSPLALLMVKIDQFKEIETQFTGTGTNAILVDFAKRLRSVTRPYDSLGRSAEDEFMIVLPDTDQNSAWTIAERILKTIGMVPVVAGEEIIPATVSIGIGTASFVDDTPEHSELIERTKTALDTAIRNGGDQVIAATRQT